jgi:hypothetical protein
MREPTQEEILLTRPGQVSTVDLEQWKGSTCGQCAHYHFSVCVLAKHQLATQRRKPIAISHLYRACQKFSPTAEASLKEGR